VSCDTAAQLPESVSRSAPKNEQNLAMLKMGFLLSAASCFCGSPSEENTACRNLVVEQNEACGGIDFTCLASRLSRLPRSR
jgi:hypothetical protein